MKHWLQLVAGVLLSVLAALAALGGILQATGNTDSHHDSRVGGVVIAVVFAFAVVACIRLAVHAEHAIRARNPSSPAHAGELPPPPGIRFGRARGRGRYAPAAAVIVLLEFVGGFVACAVAAPIVHGEWTRTQRVQQHGIVALGTVTRAHNVRHTSKSSTWYTASVTVQLAMPVGGAWTTVAHFPHATGLVPGNEVRVLLDPRDPRYAEFPGWPSTRRSAWIALTVCAVALGLLDVLFAWLVLQQHRHRRLHRARPGLVPPLPATGL